MDIVRIDISIQLYIEGRLFVRVTQNFLYNGTQKRCYPTHYAIMLCNFHTDYLSYGGGIRVEKPVYFQKKLTLYGFKIKDVC